LKEAKNNTFFGLIVGKHSLQISTRNVENSKYGLRSSGGMRKCEKDDALIDKLKAQFTLTTDFCKI